jgi:succinate dehydrogenase / fumarate reductase, cytochrome b subunit
MAQSTTRRGPVSGTFVPAQPVGRRKPFLVELYGSAVGKKYAMAISGIVGMGYVFLHMVGNLKMFLGPEDLDEYAEWLRRGLLHPILPDTWALWILRIVLIAAFVVHLHAAYALTVVNRRARPVRYQSAREYVVANFASRTMRVTGIIVLLFLAWHLADLTWGWVNPGFVRGAVYRNVDASLSRWPVAMIYIAGNIALAVHLFHGAWSLFQSLGWNNPRFNAARRQFAVAFAAIILVGNVSMPVAALAGIVDV